MLKLIALYIIFSPVQSLNERSFLRIWTNHLCQGDPEWEFIRDGSLNLNVKRPGTNTLSSQQNGLWKVSINFGNESQITLENQMQEKCTTHFMKKNITMVEFNLFGDPFQNETMLALYSKERFQGSEITISESGKRFALHREFKARSYWFTGPKDWQYYTDNDEFNQTQCLRRDKNATITYSTNTKETLTISSIDVGCKASNVIYDNSIIMACILLFVLNLCI